MQMKTLLRRSSAVAGLALAFLVSDRAAYAVSTPVVIPTGATITPDAAPGSTFQYLSTSLPDFPNYFPDSAEATAVSPDGKTLLILTSGYNYQLDSNGNVLPQDSSEYVFVFDISSLGRAFQIDPNIVDPCHQNPKVQVAFPAQVSLVKRTDLCYRGYDNKFPDFFRYKEWSREFDQFVKHNNLQSRTGSPSP